MDGALVIIGIGVVYFLPAIVASLRGHHNAGAITILTLLLGWTVFGWIIALVWACTAVRVAADEAEGDGAGSFG